MFSTVRKPNYVQETTVAKTGVNDIFEELRNKKLVLPYLNDATTARATLATEFADSNADIVFSAREIGAAGNDITVEFFFTDVVGAEKQLVVHALNGAVLVTLRGVAPDIYSTAQEVIDAINNSPAASAILLAALAEGSDGTGIVEVFEETNLSGGADGTQLTATGEQVNALADKVPVKMFQPDLSGADREIEEVGIHVIHHWGAHVMKLPRTSASTLGKMYTVINMTASAASVMPVSSGTIFGASSYLLKSKTSATFIHTITTASNGKWAII